MCFYWFGRRDLCPLQVEWSRRSVAAHNLHARRLIGRRYRRLMLDRQQLVLIILESHELIALSVDDSSLQRLFVAILNAGKAKDGAG